MKMDPDGAGEDSSAAGRLDGAHLSQLNQQRLWRLLQLSRPRYLIPVLTRGLAKAGKQNQAATQRLTSLKEQQGTEIQAGD